MLSAFSQNWEGLDWDHRTRTKGIYRITSEKHKGWSKWVDSENGNYDYLLGIDVSAHHGSERINLLMLGLQIDHRHPDVRNDLLAWGSWVLQVTSSCRGVDLIPMRTMHN